MFNTTGNRELIPLIQIEQYSNNQNASREEAREQ